MAILYPKPLQLPISSATDGQISSQMQLTPSYQAALHAAARDNHPQTAKDLIEKGAKIDKETIIRAVVGESHDVLDVLIEHGWDINVSLGHIGDALILAVGADKTTLVKFFLARGADPNRNRRGEISTALECAAYSSSISTLKLLLDAGAQIKSRSALTVAAEQGRTDVVAYLLDRGADVDEIPDNEDIDYDTKRFGLGNALCESARAGKAEVVKLLLKRDANREVRDTWGRSALDLAKLNHYADCENVLSPKKVSSNLSEVRI